MDNNKDIGIPIYPEPDKKVVDPLSETHVDAWYPSNKVAHKLWRCIECLRDINEILVNLSHQKNATKRILKIAVTPLYSLVLAIEDLFNDMLCNQETANRISEIDRKEIEELRKVFGKLLAHDNQSMIRWIRDRLSSHVDKKIHPSESQQATKEFTSEEFCRWLDICIYMVFALNTINVYSWSCHSDTKDCVRFMTNEPFIVTILLNGEDARLVGLHIANKSPREEVVELSESIIKQLEWLFRKTN